MDCKISWLEKQKTFVVYYNAYAAVKNDPELAVNAEGIIRSLSGKIEGPWVRHDKSGHSMMYTELDDGRTIVGGGLAGGQILKPGYWQDKTMEKSTSNSSYVEKTFGAAFPDKDSIGIVTEDSGTQFIKVGDKWCFLNVETPAHMIGYSDDSRSYNTWVMSADDPEGAWSYPYPGVRHGGHAGICKGLDGNWYGLCWHWIHAGYLPNQCPAIVKLHLSEIDGHPTFDIDDNWTQDDYVPVAPKQTSSK